MGKKDAITINGDVLETLANATFRVKLENNQIILAHLAGKLRLYYIKVMPGDKVIVEMSPYDLTKGRIIKRI